MRSVFTSAFAIGGAIALCFVAASLSLDFETATTAFSAMFSSGFGHWNDDALSLLRPLGETATKATLLTLTGLSVAVAFRVGLFNIGAQGQFLVGALSAAVVGAHLDVPAIIHVPLCLFAAAATGAAYASVATWFKLKRGVHEVITTIMLNWVASSLIENWLVIGPLRAQAEGQQSLVGTPQILLSAQLPRLAGDASRLNLGIVLAAAAAGALALLMGRFVKGFEWKTVGLSPDVARASGINVARAMTEAMALAGALSGIAGAVLVLGTEYKYPATIGAPWGFDGIAMALIGQGQPLGVFVVSILFGGLRAGGTALQLYGLHKSFPELMQGLALLFIATRGLWSVLGKRLARVRRPA